MSVNIVSGHDRRCRGGGGQSECAELPPFCFLGSFSVVMT